MEHRIYKNRCRLFHNDGYHHILGKEILLLREKTKKNKKLEGGSQPINSNAGTQVQKYFTNINTSCKDMEQMPRRVLVVSQETQPNLFSTPVLFC